MDDLLNAVTLVVKAPNQKVADQTVQCGMGWTIRKLKSHLSAVYPSKPHEKEQKIIYSGKLLQDDSVLGDILKLYDDDQTTHIVHLVCVEANNSSTSASLHQWPAASASPFNGTNTVSPPDVSSDGLRHRNVEPESSQSPLQQHTVAAEGQPTVYNAMYPGMMPYSPDQIFWMQQMYTQQMMAYMQYMQQGSYTDQHPPGAVPPNVADATHPNAANQPANAQAAADQPVRMNAQGGPVMDDDEDVANNDWLDWVYTFCRFSVLLSIIYFYSTLGRFVMVFSFFVLMYLFQAGWFRLRRRDVNRPRQQQQQEQPQPGPGNPQQAEPDRPERDAAPVEEAGTPATQNETNEPQTPGVLRVIVSFFMTFFTSLIPQQPPAVNAN